MGDENGKDMEKISCLEKLAVPLGCLSLEDIELGIAPTRSGVIPVISGMVNYLALIVLLSTSFC
jgi:hypothetical protein